jgi:chromosome segregation ATPase
MNQSGVAMQVRLKELDTEVRKLWDNVWKRSKERLDTLEAKTKKVDSSLASQANKVAVLEKNQKTFQVKVAAASKAVSGLQGASKKISEQQKQVADLRVKLQQMSSELAAQGKRITENEGWNESNLAYRKQVTRRLSELDKEINSLLVQSKPY